MKYLVMVAEVHYQPILVEADNEKEAILQVKDGSGDYDTYSLEYSYTLDCEHWNVEILKSPLAGIRVP